jgi:hypothetical protein
MKPSAIDERGQSVLVGNFGVLVNHPDLPSVFGFSL